ncbi:MAG: hypothetical protein SGPRY_001059, partial [Prymnesium sp.]
DAAREASSPPAARGSPTDIPEAPAISIQRAFRRHRVMRVAAEETASADLDPSTGAMRDALCEAALAERSVEPKSIELPRKWDSLVTPELTESGCGTTQALVEREYIAVDGVPTHLTERDGRIRPEIYEHPPYPEFAGATQMSGVHTGEPTLTVAEHVQSIELLHQSLRVDLQADDKESQQLVLLERDWPSVESEEARSALREIRSNEEHDFFVDPKAMSPLRRVLGGEERSVGSSAENEKWPTPSPPRGVAFGGDADREATPASIPLRRSSNDTPSSLMRLASDEGEIGYSSCAESDTTAPRSPSRDISEAEISGQRSGYSSERNERTPSPALEGRVVEDENAGSARSSSVPSQKPLLWSAASRATPSNAAVPATCVLSSPDDLVAQRVARARQWKCQSGKSLISESLQPISTNDIPPVKQSFQPVRSGDHRHGSALLHRLDRVVSLGVVLVNSLILSLFITAHVWLGGLDYPCDTGTSHGCAVHPFQRGLS